MRFWKLHLGSLLQKSLAIVVVLVLCIMWKATQDNVYTQRAVFPGSIAFPAQNCRRINTNKDPMTAQRILFSNMSTMVNKRVLILSKRTSFMRDLPAFLEASRIEYDVHYLAMAEKDRLPSLIEREKGKYIAVLFTNFRLYFKLSLWNKGLLDNYCTAFGVGIILFNQAEAEGTLLNTTLFPFKVHTNTLHFKSYYISKDATILRLVKGNNILDSEGKYALKSWSMFVPQIDKNFYRDFEVIATSNFYESAIENKINGRLKGNPVVIHDLGKRDNIQKVYFGAGLNFWPHKLLLIDALGFLSQQKLAQSLDRWIQVDIDDIFVGKSGIRMKKEDVKASIVQHIVFSYPIYNF